MNLPAPANLRIGYIHRLKAFAYWTTIGQGVISRADELGIELCLPHTDADDDLATAIHELIGQRPNLAILADSVLGAFPQVLKMCSAAGIPVIGLEVSGRTECVCVVRADEAQGAKLAVSYLFDRMGGCGKVAHLTGVGATGNHRHIEFHKLLEQHPEIVLVYEGEGQWEQAGGAEAMRAALAAHPDLRGVFAQNDHMAVGAASVIAELGLGDQIVVVGFDADPDGLIAIREERLAATVYRGLYGIGRTAVDLAVRIVQGEHVAAEMLIPVTLITTNNLVEATLDTTYMLPGLVRDLVKTNRAQRQLAEEMIRVQRSIIQELSTPIIPISDSILIIPLIGAIDTGRAQQITEALLQAIVDHAAQYIIIDITGIAVVDTAIAHHLLQAARAAELLGAHVILVGISPEVAQTLVGLGVDLRTIHTRATLQSGFEHAQAQLTQDRRHR